MHTHKGDLVLIVLSLNLALNVAQTSGLFGTHCKLVPSLTYLEFHIAPRSGVD